MALDLKAEVALLEQNRRAVAAQHRVAQAGLEPVPSRGQRAGQVANIFVIHAQERAEAVLFHHRAGPLGAVFSQPVPIDPLLPIHSGDAEIRSHVALPTLIDCPFSSVAKTPPAQAFAAAPRRASAAIPEFAQVSRIARMRTSGSKAALV